MGIYDEFAKMAANSICSIFFGACCMLVLIVSPHISQHKAKWNILYIKHMVNWSEATPLRNIQPGDTGSCQLLSNDNH